MRRHVKHHEQLLYSERELTRIVRMRNFHETKAAQNREKKEQDRARRAIRVAAKEQRRK